MARALASGRPVCKAELRGRLVQRRNLQRVVLLGDDNAGMVLLYPLSANRRLFAGKRFSRRGVAPRELTFDAVDGKPWQPQAEDTPPVR